MTYIKNVTPLLDSLNNDGNFYKILSNNDSIFSQENRHKEYYHFSIYFLLKFATMNGQT